jgi:hypothetical protein
MLSIRKSRSANYSTWSSVGAELNYVSMTVHRVRWIGEENLERTLKNVDGWVIVGLTI